MDQAPSQRQTGTVSPLVLVLAGHSGFLFLFLMCVCGVGGGSVVVVVVVGEPVNVTAELLLSHRGGGGSCHGFLLLSVAAHRASSPASILLISSRLGGTGLESHDSLVADRWRHTTLSAIWKPSIGTFLAHCERHLAVLHQMCVLRCRNPIPGIHVALGVNMAAPCCCCSSLQLPSSLCIISQCG